MDWIEELGELALASRLRRLSERLARDASRIYADQSLDFEARWFPILSLLGGRPADSITSIAEALRLTHPAVNQLAGEMETRGLIRSVKDKQDDRKRLLELTPDGEKVREALQPIWEDIRAATREMISRSGSDLLTSLRETENALDRKNMYERVRGRINARLFRSIEIIDYAKSLRHRFRELNEQWLENGFQIEEADRRILEDPETEILAGDGVILFARLNDRIIGTCALRRIDSTSFELCKMAVDPMERGKQVGRRLAMSAISRAIYLRAGRLLLMTSPDLIAANGLYRSLGFTYVPDDEAPPVPYERSSYWLALDLNEGATRKLVEKSV